ncbi:CPBP family intramembrane glutamic endopeptidase [Streptomyces sp. NPDC006326]|uniref:CPBP family intramembrane glutamic endopeptidase n=1 Tax=Streptomyces sp. NPDC006326 TaxID=3156752 RepID=UPI00339DDDA8
MGSSKGTAAGAAAASRGRTAARAGVFLAVAFLASGLLGGMQAAAGVPAEVLQLTQFGPALAVAAVALLWPGEVRALLAGALRGAGRGGETRASGTGARASRTGLRASWALPATALLVIGGSVAAYGLVTGDVRFTGPAEVSGHSFALIVAAQFLGACGEEIGWRCLLQPLLRTRWGVFASSVVVGLLWGAWHVPVFAQAPAYAGAFLLATVGMSVVLGRALDRVRSYRLPLAGGFHLLINLGMLLFMDEESGAVLPMALLALASLAAGAVWTGAVRTGAVRTCGRRP